MQKAFYNINEPAILLGLSTASIYAHLSRKNFEAIPPPTYLGRRLAWPVISTEEWIEKKSETAVKKDTQPTSQKIGRPSKMELHRKKYKNEG